MADRVPVRCCDLCGRCGTRRFDVLPPAVFDHPTLGPVPTIQLVSCTGRVSCHRRALRKIPVAERGGR